MASNADNKRYAVMTGNHYDGAYSMTYDTRRDLLFFDTEAAQIAYCRGFKDAVNKHDHRTTFMLDCPDEVAQVIESTLNEADMELTLENATDIYDAMVVML